MSQRRCPDCDGSWLGGNGRCAVCHGTGVNPHLNSDEPKCPACGGTGVCPSCKGTGLPGGDPADPISLGLD